MLRDPDVAGQATHQNLTQLAGAPMGLLALEPDNQALDLLRQLVGIADRTTGTVGEGLEAAFFVAIEDLVAGFARYPELAAHRGHRLPIEEPGDEAKALLSPDAISSEICGKEIAFAASLNKRFAPVVCRPVDVANVPSELSRLNFISFEDKARFENNVDKLADALSTDIEWIRKHTEFGELAPLVGSRKRHSPRCGVTT